MSHDIEVTSGGVEDLRQLFHEDRRLYARVTAKIRTLADAPDQGKPLRQSLKGMRSLRVGDRRIVYRVDEI